MGFLSHALEAFPQSLNLPPSNCLRSAKRRRWPGVQPMTLGRSRWWVQAPPHTPANSAPRLLVLCRLPALLPGRTRFSIHDPALFSFIHSPPPPHTLYFLILFSCLLPLEGIVHDGKDFFFNLLVHPHQLEQSRALAHSDHICLMNSFFVENKKLWK